MSYIQVLPSKLHELCSLCSLCSPLCGSESRWLPVAQPLTPMPVSALTTNIIESSPPARTYRCYHHIDSWLFGRQSSNAVRERQRLGDIILIVIMTGYKSKQRKKKEVPCITGIELEKLLEDLYQCKTKHLQLSINVCFNEGQMQPF